MCFPVNMTKFLKASILRTSVNDGFYWFKVEEIIDKTETYSETIIGDIFRT